MNRSLRRLYLTLAGGFVGLMLMLGWWQVVAAPDLSGERNNPQRIQRERLIDRGRIVSADGKTLAASRAVRSRGQKVFQRVYPQKGLAANAVGYAFAEDGSKTGLESSYDRFLSGSFGTEPLLQRLNVREKKGADVHLFLDTRVQRAAVAALGSNKGAIVALDPATGGVLALASSPNFDPNRVRDKAYNDLLNSSSDAPLFDRATQGRYAPGSTFKVVTSSAALSSGLYTPFSEFPGGVSYDTPGGPISNFGGARYGPHTLQTALTNSINTTFAEIGDELGGERLGTIMGEYGFGERPPIDLPDDEVLPSGRLSEGKILPNVERGADTARIAIGQELLSVTPLQMAMVAAGVANGGVVRAPRLMSRVVDQAGQLVSRAQMADVGQPLSADNAAALTQMMEDVVNEGTGTSAALGGLAVAGKTGTAETDVSTENQAWFIGFAPADAPQVAVAVVIEDTSGTGGVVAAPVARQVLEAAIEAAG